VIVAFADTCAEPGPDAQQLAEGHAGHAMHARAHTHTQQHGCIAVVGHTRLRARAAAASALRGAAQHACTRARRRGCMAAAPAARPVPPTVPSPHGTARGPHTSRLCLLSTECCRGSQ
jgi:hypothetical protein